MALFGCLRTSAPRCITGRIRSAGLALGLLTICGACSLRAPQPAAPSAATTTANSAAIDAGVELPLGPGREILVTACLGCHDLGGLALFKGVYARDSWRELVLTMKGNGAASDEAGVEVVADYLARHFGPN
jgi:hypothetical protein